MFVPYFCVLILDHDFQILRSQLDVFVSLESRLLCNSSNRQSHALVCFAPRRSPRPSTLESSADERDVKCLHNAIEGKVDDRFWC